ncbi:MAG: DoxX family protein [Rhodobacteraceae bacterium]|nr:DoxX family protein [Paracoccaceae bacterium]
MNTIINLHDGVFSSINRALGTWFLPTLARFTFAAVLLVYFWKSAKTKLGDGFLGFFRPTDNGYIQVFPKKFEELGYDSSQFGFLDTLIVMAGTWAEFILPLMIVIGFCTRLAAIGMVGFVFVQSIVDITGHGVDAKTIGAWFDGPSGSLILDQRLLWMVLFAILIVKGAGPISADAVLRRARS